MSHNAGHTLYFLIQQSLTDKTIELLGVSEVEYLSFMQKDLGLAICNTWQGWYEKSTYLSIYKGRNTEPQILFQNH